MKNLHWKKLSAMGWKIIIKSKIILSVLLLYLPGLVYCQYSKINIYGAGIYEIPYGDFRCDDIYPGKGNANEGSSINLGNQYRIFNKVFVGIESAYYKFGPRENVANYDVYTTSYSFVMNVSYYLQQNDFRPYVTFGVGISATTLNVLTEFFEETSTQKVPYINFIIGSDMMITNHTALSVIIRWSDAFIKDKSFTYDHFNTLKPEFNVNFVGLGLGFRYWIY
jgi:hypothetical protein